MQFAVVIVLFLLLWAVLQVVAYFFIKGNFGRARYPDREAARWFYRDYAEKYSRVSVCFPSGRNRLRGYIYGDGNRKGLVVFAHGIGCGHESYIKEILWLVDNGWCVFAYDATGSCESEGSGTRGLVQSALDLRAALRFVKGEARLRGLPICLMGHSWGGYAVAAALSFGEPITACVSISAYNDPLDMMMRYARATMGNFMILVYPLVWINQRILFGKYASLTAVKGINATDAPVLIVHGREDELVYLDVTSVARHEGELTNPNARVHVVDWRGRCGHGSIFYDAASAEYIEEIDRRCRALSGDGATQTSAAEREAFLRGIDKALYNRPNEALLREIDSFFSEATERASRSQPR